MSSFRFDVSGLKTMVAILSQNHSVRVGILNGGTGGEEASKVHKDSKLTNAEIGAVHEYGSFTGGFGGHGIPKRSFLRDPLRRNHLKIVGRALDAFQHSLAGGPIVDFFDAVGATLVKVVHDAFKESGPGWKELSPVTIAMRKRNHKGRHGGGERPLWDTGELQRSISFKVVKGK